MDWLFIGILLTAFFLLGSNRLNTNIRAVAIQGAFLAFVPFALHGPSAGLHIFFLTFGTLIIKTFVIPLLLNRSLRDIKSRREAEPMTSLHLSLFAGGLIAVLSFSVLKILPDVSPFPLIIPSALSLVLIGFFILVSRQKAVTQVLGFLVLENGVFLFGTTLVADFPLTVELGVLLDLLVGVFVMGIMIHHINRTFDHIDTSALTTLKDTEA